MNRFFNIIAIAALLILPALFFISCNSSDNASYSRQGKISLAFGRGHDYSDILVVRAVDGDTLKLDSGERVCLIGIDTPEIHESYKL